MGYQEDQRLPGERAEQEQEQTEHPPPAYTPALPPRDSFQELHIQANTESPDSSGYLSPEATQLKRSEFTWTSRDPRNASTDSLLPDVNPDGKRKLLLIYVHGFLGNETSFQSFPAHVHNLVRELMVESHIVHTKIYPRYKSRRAIEFARDGFSSWLRPHESPETDVILLGHSMGGILSAEVVLQPSNTPDGNPLLNRILGTINFDVPFLGMHPGVIASGIGSLFRPGDKSQDEKPTSPRDGQVMMPMPAGEFDLGQSPSNTNMLSQSSSRAESGSLGDLDRASRSMSPLSIPVDDPNYNPQFENDVIRPVRKGWDSALYFFNKHSGNLRQAAKAYVTSHVEFGGTMADYPKLHTRYKKVRALEDVDDMDRARNHLDGPSRVRFVNFYTASTGVSKPKSRSPSSHSRGRQLDPNEIVHSNKGQSLSRSVSSTRSISPKISVENPDGIQTSIEDDEINDDGIQSIDPRALSDDDDDQETDHQLGSLQAIADGTKQSESKEEDGLPPLPPVPTQPADFDSTAYPDKDVLKVAQKEHSRKMKAYHSAIKDREKTISDRKKMLEKREKKAAKEQEKAMKDHEKAMAKEAKLQAKRNKEKEKEDADETSKADTPTTSHDLNKTGTNTSKASKTSKEPAPAGVVAAAAEKTKRDRKFCILPPKQNGMRDATWVRVFMEGVDEVGAHCGLFFADKQHYEGLVGDVGELVREWVRRDMLVRQLA